MSEPPVDTPVINTIPSPTPQITPPYRPPISGSVSMVNEMLVDEPQLLSESPEDKGWICRLTDFDSSDVDDMMNEEEYLKYIDSL